MKSGQDWRNQRNRTFFFFIMRFLTTLFRFNGSIHSPSPVHLKAEAFLQLPTPPFLRRRYQNSKTKAISGIGEKIADANSNRATESTLCIFCCREERRVGSVRHVTLANTARLPLYFDRSTDVGICMGPCASRRRLYYNIRFNGLQYRGCGVRH